MYMIFYSVIRCGPYPQVPVRFKKKNQLKSPSPESRTPNSVRIRQSGRSGSWGVTGRPRGTSQAPPAFDQQPFTETVRIAAAAVAQACAVVNQGGLNDL